MKPEEFTEEHIQRVFEIYQQYCGGAVSIAPSYSLILEYLQADKNRDGYRIGSKWSGHSKLRFVRDGQTNEVTPRFIDNMDFNDQSRREAVREGKKFEKKSLEYLCSQEQKK